MKKPRPGPAQSAKPRSAKRFEPQPPFEHPNKMDVKSNGAHSDDQSSGKRASGSDKSKEPKQGGDAARKAHEWSGGSKGAKGPTE